MPQYNVGEIIENFRGHSEGTQFELSDDGAQMLVFFHTPTENEIAQFKSGKSFEIRFVQFQNVTMLLTKIGNLNWMDAPYNQHLSEHLSKIEFPDKNQGLSLLLILVDTSTGELKHMRFIGLSTKFSKTLLNSILNDAKEPWKPEEYYNNINEIFVKYTTKDLVKCSNEYYRINN